jgi:phosphoribosylformimino-5-aminoimidazole carboxamide ribonucleotide (ProFAR) isomerase
MSRPDVDGGAGGPHGTAADGTEFLIIPSVSVQKGRVVVVNKGRYEPLLDAEDRELSIADFVKMYLADYKTICIIDIDGIEKDRPQLGHISTVSRDKNIWYDPGVRDVGDMADAFMAGANRVIVGTKTLASRDDLLECHETSSDYVLGLDWSGHILSGDATISQADPLDFLAEMRLAGVRRVLFTQLGRVRRDARIDEPFVREMVKRVRRLYLGGSGFDMATAEEIRRSELGVRGVIVGILDLIKEDLVPEDEEDIEGGGVVVDNLGG